MITRLFKHIAFLMRWNLMSIRSRVRPTLVIVFGFAGVVSVFVAVLSIQEGFRIATEGSGNTKLAMVLSKGAKTELGSLLQQSDINNIRTLIKNTAKADSNKLSAEMLHVVNIPQLKSNVEASVPIRGVEISSFALKDTIKIIKGRVFKEGVNEIIVGRGVAERYAGMSLDSEVQWGRYKWRIVGIFEAKGGTYESEIWSDVNVLKSAYQRENSYQSVYFNIRDETQFKSLKELLEKEERLSVTVYKESEYFKTQSKFQQSFISSAGVVISMLMAVGAVFGAINMTHSSIASRSKEIGILRAIGFNRFLVMLVMIIESVILGLFGGIVGGITTWLLLNGFQTSTVNFESFSQVVFAFSVTPELLTTGLMIALTMGLIGGVPSAWSAARSTVVDLVRGR